MREKQRYLFVDGYNVLNAWRQGMAGRPLEDARRELVEKLHDYAGYSGQTLVVVFDAQLSGRRLRSYEEMGRLSVVYTQHGETADHYIERLCGQYAHRVEIGACEVRVATSDGVEQTVILGRGATRLSARELLNEMEAVRVTGRRAGASAAPKKTSVLDALPPEVRERLEKMRRGE